MPPPIAAAIFIFGILVLFYLDKDSGSHTSKALWIPTAWLLITGSRPVSFWLGRSPEASADQYLEGSPVDRAVFAALLILGLIVLIGRASQVGLLLRSNAPILLFFFYCAVSVLWSEYPEVAFKRWTKAVGDPMMAIIVITDPDWRNAIKRIFARASFLLIPLSVLLIKYYPQYGREYSKSWQTMYSGVTTHKNTLGMICLFFGLGALWRFLEDYRNREDKNRTRRLIAHGAILAMVIWLFWMSNSMTALASFLMSATLLLAIRRPIVIRMPSLVHLLGLGLIVVSLFAILFDSAGSLVGTLGRNANLTGRTDIWRTVLSMAGNPLLGTGFESFWLGKRLELAWAAHFEGLVSSHNGYLEVFVNLGWIGIILLVSILITGYRKISAAFRRDPAAGSLWVAFFYAAVTSNLTESYFRMLTSVWIFLLLSVFAVSRVQDPVLVPVDPTGDFGEPEPQFERLFSVPPNQESF